MRSGERRVKIDGRDVPPADLGDQLSHWQSPVAEMHIAQHAPGIGSEESLQRVAYDGRPQMTDMHRFCDIGSAEIDDKQFSDARFRSAETRVGRHVGGPEDKRVVGYVEIDESSACNLHFR